MKSKLVNINDCTLLINYDKWWHEGTNDVPGHGGCEIESIQLINGSLIDLIDSKTYQEIKEQL